MKNIQGLCIWLAVDLKIIQTKKKLSLNLEHFINIKEQRKK